MAQSGWVAGGLAVEDQVSVQPIRYPGEDLVQYRNRVLSEQGRIDIEWYWTSGGQMRLRETGKHQPNFDFGRAR